MRCFKNIANLIRTKRLQHPKAYSQSELSHLLGYKNGQFISNVERALCNIPLKMLVRVADILDIEPADLKKAIIKDHDQTLENYFSVATPKTDVQRLRSSLDSKTTTEESSSFKEAL